MASVLDFLTESAEELGLIGAGQTLSAEDADYAFRRLNRRIDRAQAENLLVPYPQTITVWTLVANTLEYTVGTGGDVNRARPVWVDQINYYDANVTPTTEIRLDALTDEEYRNIPQKAATATQPSAYYYNPTFGSTGFATLSFWMVPTSSTLRGVMYAPTAIAPFTSLAQTVSVPPGYHDFLVYETALMLAPGFRREPSESLIKLHAEAKSTVQAMNLRQSDLKMPWFGGRGAGFDYGYLSGWGGR